MVLEILLLVLLRKMRVFKLTVQSKDSYRFSVLEFVLYRRKQDVYRSCINVKEFERDGYEWAQLYAFYNVRQSTQIVKVTEEFLMRKDEDGRWKIFGWQEAKSVQ